MGEIRATESADAPANAADPPLPDSSFSVAAPAAASSSTPASASSGPTRRDDAADGARRRGPRQFGVLGEDRALQILQLAPGFDPELVDQPAARLLIARQRLGLATRSVQREHQLRLQALSQRMLAREHLKLADQRCVAAEREVRVDPILQRR